MLMQIHCIYNWYSFDDEAMIDALYEIASIWPYWLEFI